MKKKLKYAIFTVVALAAIAAGLLGWRIYQSQPSKYDAFAKCLKNKEAVFYGAFWCSHCDNQKKLFGSAKQYLPYVECSTADGSGQLDICKNENIQTYPTWRFKDGSEEIGEIPLALLSQKSGCELPK